MKKLLLFLSALFLSVPAFATPESTGIGLTLGSPYGVTGRTWLDKEKSIDYGVGWDLLNSDKLMVYSDYLWNRPDSFEINGEKFDVFFGGGLVLRTHSATNEDTAVFGPRVPVGVSYWLTHPDMELFAQFALDLGLVPHADVFVDLNVGVRFTIF